MAKSRNADPKEFSKVKDNKFPARKVSHYEPPKLTPLGSLKELSQTASIGSKTDGGAFPSNKHMCLTPPSALEEHRILLRDHNCQEAYQKAIQDNVKEGDVVLDLGTGSGIHTLFAVRAGAKKVYALDLHPLIEVAKEVIFDNGFSDRVEFVRGNSREIELPEKVDVIISNIGFLHTINDLHLAASKFLKPGGRVLPDSAVLSIVPISDSHLYATNVNNWNQKNFSFDFSAFRKLAVNHPVYFELKESAILCAPKSSPPIDFTQTIPKVMRWNFNFEIQRDSTVHGFGGWYGFNSLGEEFLTTKPPMKLERDLWQNFVFPLQEPLTVQAGVNIELSLEMHREMFGEAPLWRWNTVVNGEHKYSQNSFPATPIH